MYFNQLLMRKARSLKIFVDINLFNKENIFKLQSLKTNGL